MTFTLASIGWDAGFAGAYARFAAPGHRSARVIRADQGIATVLTATGAGLAAERASLGGATLARGGRGLAALPCVGDWVVLRAWPDRRLTVEAVLPRRTEIAAAADDRRGPGDPRGPAGSDTPGVPGASAASDTPGSARGHGPLLAANVDVLAVVESASPPPDLARLARLTRLARECGFTPVVLLTRADRSDDPEALARRTAAAIEVAAVRDPGPGHGRDLGPGPGAGVGPGVETVAVSVRDGRNLGFVRSLAGPGRTLGLIGAPGSGASGLVNVLAGAVVLAPSGVRRQSARRRAPAFPALTPLPGGGAVIDVPDPIDCLAAARHRRSADRW